MATKSSHADNYRAIPTPTLIKLHPLPLLTIVDAHERRRPGLEKVIGCLIGRRVTGDVVEVTDCFLVPHEEGDSPSSSFTIDTKTLENVIQQHRIMNPGEKLLGWFSSSAKHLDKAASVHRLWLKQVAQPIFLTLDCLVSNTAHLDIKTYVGIPTTGSLDAVFGSGGGVAAAFEFVSIPFDVICFPTERAALDLVQITRKKPQRQHLVPSDTTTVQEVIDSMDELLTRCIKFVRDAKKIGSSALDPEVGRALATLVHSIPRMTAEDYERVVNGERKDFLMTTFVAGIIEAQVALQEKVNMIMY